jgi:hypothetical protein
MLCFRWPTDKTLFLFVMESRHFKKSELPHAPSRVARISRLLTQTWTEDGKVYLLAGPEDDKDFGQFVGNGKGVLN